MGLGLRSQNTITETNCVGSSRWMPSTTSSAFIALFSHVECKAAACFVLTRRPATISSRVYSSLFSATITDIDENWVADGGRTLEKLSASLPSLLTATSYQWSNVIVPPLTQMPPVQLEKLDSSRAARLRYIAFLVIETSKANFQAWVAMTSQGETRPKRLKESSTQIRTHPNPAASFRTWG